MLDPVPSLNGAPLEVIAGAENRFNATVISRILAPRCMHAAVKPKFAARISPQYCAVTLPLMFRFFRNPSGS